MMNHTPASSEEMMLNKSLKEKLCEEAEALMDSTLWRETAEKLKSMQQEWRQIGPVPRENVEFLNQRFRAACDTFFDNRSREFQAQELERIDNLLRKTKLCEKAEALTSSGDIPAAIDELQLLFQEWKSIGPVPREKSDMIWERFRKAQDVVYGKRKQMYEELDKERNDNLIIKISLCEEAEKLQTSDDFNKTTPLVIELQERWRNTGPVPREKSDDLWDRFRNACDTFFERKRIHYEEKRIAWQKSQAAWRMNMEKVIERKEEEIERLLAACDYDRNHIAEWQHRIDNLPEGLRSIDFRPEMEEKIKRSSSELERKEALIRQLEADIADIKNKLLQE